MSLPSKASSSSNACSSTIELDLPLRCRLPEDWLEFPALLTEFWVQITQAERTEKPKKERSTGEKWKGKTPWSRVECPDKSRDSRGFAERNSSARSRLAVLKAICSTVQLERKFFFFGN